MKKINPKTEFRCPLCNKLCKNEDGIMVQFDKPGSEYNRQIAICNFHKRTGKV